MLAKFQGSKKWLFGAALALSLQSIIHNFHRLPSDLLGMRTMEHAHAPPAPQPQNLRETTDINTTNDTGTLLVGGDTATSTVRVVGENTGADDGDENGVSVTMPP